MKTITIYALVLLSPMPACTDREEKETTSIQVTAMVDVTDRRIVLPNAETILSLFNFKGDKDKEAYFRMTTITDKLLNPSVEEYLPSGSETEKENQFDDPDFREKQVLAFYRTIGQTIDTFNASNVEDTTLRQSECFRSIAQELTRMKEHHRDKSVLIIYGDLRENSDLIRVYSDSAMNLLVNYPDSIQQRFEATNLLPNDLNGFTVLFIFQPTDKVTDVICNQMAMIYKKLITARGGKVLLISNNPKYIQF